MTTVRILWNEIQLGLWISLHYRFNIITRLIAMALKFVGYSLFLFNGTLQAAALTSPLIGYLVWFFAFFIFIDMSYTLRETIQEGTIEQLFMSPASPLIVVLGRILATALVTAVKAFLTIGVLIFAFSIPFPITVASLLVFVIALISCIAVGLIISAITLITKRTESLGILLSNISLFVSGTILPIESLPHSLQLMANVLPTTHGIIVLRKLMVDNLSLLATWHDGSLKLLLVNACCYSIASWIIFSFCVAYVQKKGTLNQY